MPFLEYYVLNFNKLEIFNIKYYDFLIIIKIFFYYVEIFMIINLLIKLIVLYIFEMVLYQNYL